MSYLLQLYRLPLLHLLDLQIPVHRTKRVGFIAENSRSSSQFVLGIQTQSGLLQWAQLVGWMKFRETWSWTLWFNNNTVIWHIVFHKNSSLQGGKGGCLSSLQTGSSQSWQRKDYGKNQGHVTTSSSMAGCSYSASHCQFSVWAQNTSNVVFPWLLVHMWIYFKLLAVILKWCWASGLLNLSVLTFTTWQGVYWVPSQPGICSWALISEKNSNYIIAAHGNHCSFRPLYWGAKTVFLKSGK